MEIIVGKTAGFCYGVKRAVDGAKKLVENNDDIYCLGELVHNKEVINELTNQGMKVINNINEAKGKTIIRAHGVPKEIYNMVKEKNIELEDFTCPNVAKIHEIAQEYSNNDYYIFLFGSREHPENIGTMSFCGKDYSIINKNEDIEKAIEELKKSNKKDLLIISQTTYSLEDFNKFIKIIEERLKENYNITIKNTICRATELRQKETEDISKKVDLMIIIGGKNSSNTQKLFNIAKEYCKNAMLIENSKELNIEDVKKHEKIGIMAGASTPQKSIDEILNILNK